MKPCIIIMGVSGCGKTTAGKKLAKKLNISFLDADDFHSETNIKKMSQGKPLTDEDRMSWLFSINLKLMELSKEGGFVLACSALKEKYREILSRGISEIKWIFLSGSPQLIRKRMEGRKNHFMKPEMLDSQFRILEIPNYAITVEIDQDLNQIMESITSKLRINE